MYRNAIQGSRILLVADPSPYIQDLETLLHQGGYTTERSTVHPLALSRAYAQFQPDLVLFDLNPEASLVLDLLKQLKMLVPPGDFLPVLVLLARDEQTLKREALAAGAKDCLTRPLDEIEASHRIANLLESRLFLRGLWSGDPREPGQEPPRAPAFESLHVPVSGLAHDLKNLMTALLMNSEMLQAYVNVAEGTPLLSTMQATIETAVAMLDQLLQLTRGSKGKREYLQPAVLINQILRPFMQTLPASIEIQVETASDLWLVPGDSTPLQQVVLNLCANARDAMPKGGQLRITAENHYREESPRRIPSDASPGHYVLLTVQDSGTGIPPELRARIFEPFVTTKETGRNLGLGLSIVNKVIQNHGGFIEVESEVGQGTQFRLYLPALEPTPTSP
jgi:signal transduction histidine kinase